MADKTGGPAFPQWLRTELANRDTGPIMEAKGGMSLRDYFASKAMAAYVLAGNTQIDLQIAFQNKADREKTSLEVAISRLAYHQADAMLEVRNYEE